MPKIKGIACLSQEKPTADTIAGNESNVCRHMTPAAGVNPRRLRRIDLYMFEPLCTHHSWGEIFWISTSSGVADVAAHYAFRTHQCAAVSTEPPAGCSAMCRICTRAFHFGRWRYVENYNHFTVIIKDEEVPSVFKFQDSLSTTTQYHFTLNLHWFMRTLRRILPLSSSGLIVQCLG